MIKKNEIVTSLGNKIFCPFTGKLIYDSNSQKFLPSKATLQISKNYNSNIEDLDNPEEIILYAHDSVKKFIDNSLSTDIKIIDELENRIHQNFEAITIVYLALIPRSFHISYNPNY